MHFSMTVMIVRLIIRAFCFCWIVEASEAIHRRIFESKNYRKDNRTSTRRTKTVQVDIPSSPDGHLIQDALPLTKSGQELKIKHWAGHLPASNDQQKYFFYWLFEPEKVDANTPLLIWLNGGPGCSSMDGLFLENGPIQWTVVDGKYMLQQNPFSWHKAPAYTLYIDQPVGTGLSFTTEGVYPSNDEAVNIDFYYFLTEFLKLHADKFMKAGNTVSRPLYFSGESHAGHYIPSMMNFILKKNKAAGNNPIVPLAGAAIGNGWMDPSVQYAGAEAAYGHGLLGMAQVNTLAEKELECQASLAKGYYRTGTCFDLLDNIIAQSYGKNAKYTVCQYDVRISERRGAPRKFPKGHKVVEGYLGGYKLPEWETGTLDESIKDTVLEAIHASAATAAGQRFEECTDPPYNALAHQDGLGVVDDIIAVLEDESKPRLLFFNGIEDLICNHVGNEKVLENLQWKGRDAWMTAKRYAWMPTPNAEQAAGFIKEYDNLLFLKLMNAGHMVPMDLPETSLQMITIFMAGKSFADSLQDIETLPIQPLPSCPICPTCLIPEECPKCSKPPLSSSPTDDQKGVGCTQAVEDARNQVLSDYAVTGSGSKSFVWTIPLAGMLLVLYGVVSWRMKREQTREQPAAADTVELPDSSEQYRDDPKVREEAATFGLACGTRIV